MGIISDDWCGWDSLPPGLQFPVKELVASLKNLRGVAKTHLFWYNNINEINEIN
jgi:hypothetical protein